MVKHGGLDAPLSKCGQKWTKSSLPALTPWTPGQLPARTGTSLLPVSQPEDLGNGQVGLPGTKCRRNAAFPEQGLFWWPLS